METRSRKSRSLTPFSVEKFSQEFVEKESLAENSVGVTRQTTTYIVKESANSVDEVTSTNKVTTKKTSGSEKGNFQSYKTSDYSSEEGDNEVSSTRIISQNEKNQIIEDARAAANGGGGEISALDLYKKSGRYWEIYPKTDYTYSPHSRDRVELAPGVVAMPNMSRRNIHSVHNSDASTSFTEVEHKETNTESYSLRSASDLYANYQPRQLFNNNYEHNYLKTSRKTSLTFWSKTKTMITSTFTRIVTIITSMLYVCFQIQTSSLSKLHKLASNVMLWDTWLLWKNNPGNKAAKLMALCVIPLLLLGGVHLLLVSGVSLVPSCHPYCRKIASTYINSYIDSAYYTLFNKTESM